MDAIDKNFFNRMVEFFQDNVGGVFALYDPKPMELYKYPDGKFKPIHKANNNIDKLLIHVKRYLDNYKLYTDLPQVTISNDYKHLKIDKSWKNVSTTSTSFNRGVFYEKSKRQ